MIIRVSPNLYRGPRPKSFKDLQALGITQVINLQSGFYELTSDDYYEFEKASEFGMMEYNIPCSDFFPPTKAQVHQVMNIINRGGLTYIHCLHGKDRTGFMCAVYLMASCGFNFKSALRNMFGLGFHKWPYLWWVPFLKKYEVKHE